MEFTCVCGKTFWRCLSRVKDGGGKYCSKECRTKYRKYKTKTIEESFWGKINKTEFCWIWTGKKLKSGYGVIQRYRKELKEEKYAHRVSWEIHKGKIPFALHVLHKCDNPSCVNPDHLFVGTNNDNVEDCVKKGRNAIGEKNGHSVFRNNDIFKIRKLLKDGRKQKEIALIYNVLPEYISKIKTKTTYSKVV